MPSPSQKKITIFGMRLRARREALKMSRADLSRAMGKTVSPSAVDSWESGVAFPFTKRLHPLATALGWSVEQLVVNTELNSIVLRGGAAVDTANNEPEPAEEVQPVIEVQKVQHAYQLMSGHINNKPVRGSIAAFAATVLTPESFDTVYLAWAEALFETSEKFSVNERKALEYLRAQYPDWAVTEEAIRIVTPELD